MMPGLGAHVGQRAGVSVAEFHNVLSKLWMRENGPLRGKLRLGMINTLFG